MTDRYNVIIRLGLEGLQSSLSGIDQLEAKLTQMASQKGFAGSPLQGRSKLAGGFDEIGRRVGAPIGGDFDPLKRATSAVTRAQISAATALKEFSDLVDAGKSKGKKYNAALDNALRSLEALDRANQTEAKAVADLSRESRQAAASLERQRAAAYAKDFREQEASRKSLDRQRQKALGDQVAQEARAVPQSTIDQVLARPSRGIGDTDLIFRKREELADRQLALQRADIGLEEAIVKAKLGIGASEKALEQQLITARTSRDTANRAVVSAEHKLATAINNAAIVSAQGTQKTFREQFVTGFKGTRDASYAEQFGQATKFSLFYGGAYKALFLISQTLTQTLQEGIAFQQAMTDLHLATGAPKEALADLATSLSRAATDAGAAPSQGVQVGARAVGLYGATGASLAERERVATISAQVVSRLAVGSGKQPTEILGDVAAIGQALGLGAQGQFRIADLDAYFTKRFGVQQGSTLQTVAESGTLGKAAGFSDEALFAISAAIQARTGQTDSAVAGFLSQIFSRGGEGSLTAISQKFGVDPTQRLSEVVADLADVFANATPQQRSEIAASFGRGRPQGAAAALLQSFPEIQKAVADAQGKGGAAGAADEQFRQRMGDIGGQLNALTGDLKDFAQLLGQSGLLDSLGLLIKVFDVLLEDVNGVLRLFNELGRPIRDTIFGLGALALALKFTAGEQGVKGLLTSAVGVRQAGVPRGLALAGLGRSPEAFAGASGALRGSAYAAGARGFAAAGAAAAASVGPFALAVGGLLALGSIKNTVDRLGDAAKVTEQTLGSRLAPGSGASAFEAQASAYSNAADENANAVPGWLNFVSFGKLNNPTDATAAHLEASAKYLSDVASRVGEGTAAAGSNPFQDFSGSGLDATLQNLAAGGANSARQVQLLNEAINGLGGESTAAVSKLTKINPENFAGRLSQDIPGALTQAASQKIDFGAYSVGGKGSPYVTPEELGLYPKDVGKAIEAQLKALGITTAGQLTPEVIAEISEGVLGTRVEQFFTGDKNAKPDSRYDVLKKPLTDAISESLTEYVNSLYGGVLGTRELNPSETLATIQKNVEASTQKLAGTPQKAYGARISEAQRALDAALKTLAQGSTNEDTLGSVNDAIQQARNTLAREQVAQFEALRQVAVRGKDEGEANRIGRSFLGQEIAAVVNAGADVDALAEILGTSSKAAVAMARTALEHALQTAEAALAAETLLGFPYAAGTKAGVAGGPFAGLFKAPEATPEATAAQANIDNYKQALANLAALVSAEPGSGIDDADSGGPTAAQIAASRASAYAQRNGGAIASAQAAIQTARADMAAAGDDQAAYYSALGQLFAAQQQLADALLAYQRNVALLRIDATNPLQVARLEARLAARKLAQDRASGKGKDVIAQDRVDLRAAQANAEATAFSQRLQSVQTAEELGRISHSKYINYLENEKRRLESIKKRTFQQQDQLNQIDRALKDAANQMQSQFNFGDIKLPTPYQVRRYIKENNPIEPTHHQGGAVSYPYPAVNIHVNGADTAKVTRIIRDVVGKGARVNTIATRRR